MMDKQKIKKLAQLSTEANIIPEDIRRFVLEVLSKSELKWYLRYLKLFLNKKRVYVTSTQILSDQTVNELNKIFNKEIIYNTDQNLGAGLLIKNDDMVVDFTFKSYINETIEKLKN